jgi:hypothetical protein
VLKKNKFSFAEWLNENKGQTFGTALTGRQDRYKNDY